MMLVPWKMIVPTPNEVELEGHVPTRFCMDDIGKDVVLRWR